VLVVVLPIKSAKHLTESGGEALWVIGRSIFARRNSTRYYTC
jgi:hypothetical protein